MEREPGGRSPRDPRGDPARWERLVGSIHAAAAPELARLAARYHPVLRLAAWLEAGRTPTVEELVAYAPTSE